MNALIKALVYFLVFVVSLAVLAVIAMPFAAIALLGVCTRIALRPVAKRCRWIA